RRPTSWRCRHGRPRGCACTLAPVLPMAEQQPRAVHRAARCCVVEVELAVGAVGVAREHRARAEERGDEVAREARGSARRLLVEGAAGDRALEITAEAALHAGTDGVTVSGLVVRAVPRTGAGEGGERPSVDAVKTERAVRV